MSRTRRLGLMVALVALIITMSAGTIGAQTGLSTCPKERLLDHSGPVVLDALLPAGTYEVEVRVSDAYPDREFEPESQQLREQLRIVLRSKDGVSRSGASPDLEDGVPAASWQGSLGSITTATEDATLEVHHAYPFDAGPNSLTIECIWVYRVIEVPMFAGWPSSFAGGLAVVGCVLLRRTRR